MLLLCLERPEQVKWAREADALSNGLPEPRLKVTRRTPYTLTALGFDCCPSRRLVCELAKRVVLRGFLRLRVHW